MVLSFLLILVKIFTKKVYKLIFSQPENFFSVENVKDVLHKNDDEITHTNQKWDRNDYRMLRFEYCGKKQINPNPAIDLIRQVPVINSGERVVFCDGGGALGHPKVYINLDKEENSSCGYCGLRYFKESH